MQKLTYEAFVELAQSFGTPCVSVYLPLDPKHPDIEADRLTLKDLVAEARREVETTTTLRRPAVDALLAPVEALLIAERWPLGSRGYALFCMPGRTTQLRLDVDVPSIAAAGDRFVVTPLVGALPSEDRFFVLAISQDRVRFFRGGRDALVAVAVPGLPASLDEALRYERRERQLTMHGRRRQGVERIAGSRGSPSDRDLRKRQLVRFFRMVEESLRRVLHDETAPLFVAGVAYETALYRDGNRYPHLAGLVPAGSPDRMSADELHAKVWPSAARTLDGPRRGLLEAVISSPEPLVTLPAILAACRQGRVGALLVRPDRLAWGKSELFADRTERLPGDIDLVSTAIGAALEQGATVHPMAAGELPGDAHVAAVPRY